VTAREPMELKKPKRASRKRVGGMRIAGLNTLTANGDEPASRDFMSDIFAAASTMQVLRRLTAQPFGLSSTELAVMVAVAKINSNPSVRRIADHLHVSASNVTADVGKLVKARLLTKLPDPEDGRAIKVALTEKGEKLIQDIAPALRTVNERLFANMSSHEMATLDRLLQQIIVEGGRLVDRATAFA